MADDPSMRDVTDRHVLLVAERGEDFERLSRALRRAGFRVDVVDDPLTAPTRLVRGSVDLLLLDLDIPEVDGLEFLSSVHETNDPPTIIVSRRDSEGDRILGLDAGADDYVVKPFSIPEMVARVGAVLRRTAASGPTSPILHGELAIDVPARRVSMGGHVVALTRREFDLLAFLAVHPHRAFSREELLRRVWGAAPDEVGAGTVTEHVRRLRRKVEDRSTRPPWIVAVRSVGYRFDP